MQGFDLDRFPDFGPEVDDMSLLVRSMQIAEAAHRDTKPRSNGKPYISHPIKVAKKVAGDLPFLNDSVFEPYSHAEIVAAALLHDVPEDCHPDFVEDIGNMRRKVLDLTLQLRNHHLDTEQPQGLNPEELRVWKKKTDFEKIKTVSYPAILIKYHDRIENLTEMSAWRLDRQQRYARESKDLAEVLDRLGQHPDAQVKSLNSMLQIAIHTLIKIIENRS